MDSRTTTFSLRILMFPWLAHGHIFPYLELAKRILKRKNFHIYLCSTAINFTSITDFIQRNSLQNSIELVELHLKPTPDLPPHYHTTKNLPSKLNLTLLKAFQTADSSFSDIVSTFKPDLVIYDIFQPWAAKISSSLSIPAVHFAAFSAATVSYVHHHYSCGDDNLPFFKELCLEAREKKSIDYLIEFFNANVCDDRDVFIANYKLSSDFCLIKTSRGFEGKYVDYVCDVLQKKILTVGPLVSDVDENENNSEVIKWLNKKKHHSTVYISFGSEYFLSKEEIEEIAKGLEICGVNFIWVIRFPVLEKSMSVEEALPQGFLGRVKDRGIVVSGWAPQANILAHPSTGAFLSHCGWSSITESMYFGVPVIGMPMKLNMFIDTRMLVDIRACLEVPRLEDGAVKGEEIAKVMNEVLAEKGGEGLRIRAQELSRKMRAEEGPALDDTAEHLWQLCMKNKHKGL